MGDGCLADQLVGQHIAEYSGLGPLVSEEHIRKTMQSVYRYNYRRSLAEHDSVQRTYALNEEAGLLVCDYGKGKRPQVPFPYFSEVWTGFEYLAASLMMAYGMVKEGVEIVENARRRYDGERRNPWDETECGPHYARAMSAFAAIPALSGFRYQGPRKQVTVAPRMKTGAVQSFWSTGTGWGSFTLGRGEVLAGGALRKASAAGGGTGRGGRGAGVRAGGRTGGGAHGRAPRSAGDGAAGGGDGAGRRAGARDRIGQRRLLGPRDLAAGAWLRPGERAAEGTRLRSPRPASQLCKRSTTSPNLHDRCRHHEESWPKAQDSYLLRAGSERGSFACPSA